MFRTFRGSALSLVGTAAALGPVAANAADEVNIYFYRQELLIRPLLDEVGFNAGPTN